MVTNRRRRNAARMLRLVGLLRLRLLLLLLRLLLFL
jgi:hypothetical protein